MKTIHITTQPSRDNLEPIFEAARLNMLTLSNFTYDDFDDISFTISFPASFTSGLWQRMLTDFQLDELADFAPDFDC